MTENEAKKLIAKFCEDIMNFARGKDMSDKELEDFCKFSDALNLSVSSLKEIQQYRAIGTVEECREARERQRGKKPVHRSIFTDGTRLPGCPVCFSRIDRGAFYCNGCGQKLDWTDTL